jgi:catechol 2,3-dioxygenase-like lactoylglutathione lyase family enzyme
VRPAAAGDEPFLRSLFEREHVRGRLHPPVTFDFSRGEQYVIERNARAFGVLALEVESEWLLNLRALAVWELRSGAGRFALKFTIARAFDELGARRIFLEVLESNAPMRGLCEALGIEPEGLYRDGYRDESGSFHNLVPYGMVREDARPGGAPAAVSEIAAVDHVQVAIPAGGERAARIFYVDALGFVEQAKPPELASRGGAWLRAGAASVHLGVDPAFHPATKAHPALRCRNYDRLIERLRALDVPIVADSQRFQGRRHCYVADPFGNRIELIEG